MKQYTRRSCYRSRRSKPAWTSTILTTRYQVWGYAVNGLTTNPVGKIRWSVGTPQVLTGIQMNLGSTTLVGASFIVRVFDPDGVEKDSWSWVPSQGYLSYRKYWSQSLDIASVVVERTDGVNLSLGNVTCNLRVLNCQ